MSFSTHLSHVTGVCVCVHVLRLECSVRRPAELGPLNQTGAVLHGLGGGDGLGGGHQANVGADCSTFLTVAWQPDHSTKYTCQLLDEQNHVKVEEDYPPDTGDPPPQTPPLQL